MIDISGWLCSLQFLSVTLPVMEIKPRLFYRLVKNLGWAQPLSFNVIFHAKCYSGKHSYIWTIYLFTNIIDRQNGLKLRCVSQIANLLFITKKTKSPYFTESFVIWLQNILFVFLAGFIQIVQTSTGQQIIATSTPMSTSSQILASIPTSSVQALSVITTTTSSVGKTCWLAILVSIDLHMI